MRLIAIQYFCRGLSRNDDSFWITRTRSKRVPDHQEQYGYIYFTMWNINCRAQRTLERVQIRIWMKLQKALTMDENFACQLVPIFPQYVFVCQRNQEPFKRLRLVSSPRTSLDPLISFISDLCLNSSLMRSIDERLLPAIIKSSTNSTGRMNFDGVC